VHHIPNKSTTITDY